MEELFEFKHANPEDEFIYNSGVNKGHTAIPNKITVCYFLNSSEKHLYTLLASFMYGEKRTCFPSIEKLMGYSGWSRRTLKKHMDGLQKARITNYIERKGTTNQYIIEELHKSPVIVHSEIVHQIRELHFKRMDGQFNDLVESYRESSLMKEIENEPFPAKRFNDIENWFLNYGVLHVEGEKESVTKGLEAAFENSPSIEEKPANRISHLKAQVQTAKSVSTIKSNDSFSVSNDPDQPKRVKKSKDYNLVDLIEWNTQHFLKYFEDSYKKLLGFDLPVQRGDLNQLRALLDRYKHTALKERIDLFFSDSSFANIKRNVYAFSSGHTQSKLDSLLNSTRSNSYKANRKQSSTSNYTDAEKAELEDWIKEISKED